MGKGKDNILSRAVYAIVYGLLRAFALLPLGAMYLFSDIVYVILYYVVRYRRKVVLSNLTQCFPDKDAAQLHKIMRRFYRNFADYIFETVKLLHISDKTIRRRMTFSNVAIMDDAVAAGRDVVVYFSHIGNWEWAPSVRLWSREAHNVSVVFGQIYRPLRNKVFDRLMLRIRSRFDTDSIPKNIALRRLVGIVRADIRFVVGFMSDQKPSHGDPERVVKFFGRPTAVITGTETLASRMGCTAVYWHFEKKSRGHYHINVVPMSENASAQAPGTLTAMYFRLLQQNITEQPSLWLWTHKRWKTSPRTWGEVNPDTIISHE